MSSRRSLREQRMREEQSRRLVLRHRWYAGGLATVLSAALVFTGMSPAVADEVIIPDPASTQSVETPKSDVPEPEPTETTPAPAPTETLPAPAPTETLPAPAPTEDDSDIDDTGTLDIGSRISLLADGLDGPIVEPLLAGTGYNWFGDSSQTGAKYIDVSKAGGRANTTSGPQALNGAVFVAVQSTGTTPPAVPATLNPNTHYWCTTGGTNPLGGTFANGDCRIRVGAGAGTWWVLEYSAPTGYTPLRKVALGNVSTGGGTTGTTAQYDYAFRVTFTSANNTSQTFAVPNTATGTNPNYMPQVGTNAYKNRTGEWVNVANNGVFPATCGVRIAMVFDVSASVDPAELTKLKNAGKAFIAQGTGLGGTGTQVGLFRFAESAEQVGSSLLPLISTANINAAGQAIDNINANGIGQYTNWDHALRAVTASTLGNFDVVLFLTDGDPTAYRSNNNNATEGQSTDVRVVNIENAVLSANLLKSEVGPAGQKTFILPVGVGMDPDSIVNLDAISNVGAPVSVDDFDALAVTLANIAKQNCGGTLTVVKKTIDANNGVIDEATNGWAFQGTSQGGAYLKTSSNNVSQQTLTTGAGEFAKGTVNYRLDLSTVANVNVNVVETVDLTQWEPTTVACQGGGTATGNAANFTVNVARNQIVTCTVTNKQRPPTQLKLVKAFEGTAYGPHDPAAWTLTATGSGTTTNYAHNETKTVTPGQYTIGEVGKPGYQQVKVECPGATLNGAVTVPVNNTVTCTVTNKSLPASFTFMKYNAAQTALAGGSFQLYSGTYPNGTVVGAPFAAATPNGYTSGPLSWGAYYILEVTPPTGYLIEGNGVVAFTLGAGDTATPKAVSLVNQPAYKNLTVSKTAVPSFDRDYDWTIKKTVNKASANVRPGQSAQFDYTVTVTPSAAQDSNFKVSGVITVTNTNNVGVPVTVTDAISGSTGANCVVTDPSRTVPASGSALFNYVCTLPNGTPTTAGTNTPTATWNAASFPGTTGTASGPQAYTFVGVNPTVTDGSVEVSDTAPEFAAKYTTPASRTVTAPTAKVFTYSRSLGSDVLAGQCKDYPNTASVPATSDQLKLESRATVQVCTGSDLSVTKSIVTSLTRTYNWSIDKSVDQTTRTVDPEGNATFNYTVIASALPYVDSAWAMSGKITVSNPNTWPVTVTVTDTPSFGANVSCSVVGGVDAVIPAAVGATPATREFDYSCTFSAAGPALNGSNTASITWNAATAFTPGSSASHNVPVAAAAWSETPVNKTVTVIDDKTNPATPVELGSATWGVDTPKEFTYSVTLPGTPNACVDFTNKTWIYELPGVKDEQKVTVCDYADLTVAKTAKTAFDRSYSFTIEKDADKTRYDVDPATNKVTANYTVTVTDGAATDSNFKVSGDITVTNPNNVPVTLTSITDSISGTPCAVTAPNLVVPANNTLTVPYTCSLAGANASTSGTNSVVVKWSTAGLVGSTGETSGTEPFSFGSATITDLNAKTVTVVDDKTNPATLPYPVLGTHTWTAKDAKQAYEYPLELTGTAGKCVDFTNTAVIVQTEQNAPETVTVCAYKNLSVEKTAVPSFDRDYDWQIKKSVDKASAIVRPGETATFDYTVTVTPSEAKDSNYKVTGSIKVTNPNNIVVPLTGVTDAIPGANCSITTSPVPASVPADGSVDIAYSCTLSAPTAGTNTATVTWNAATLPGTAGTASGPKDFTFVGVNPTTTDGTASVSDTAAEFGSDKVLQATDGVKEYTYSRNLGADAGKCATYPNTATVTPSHSAASTSNASVQVCAPAGNIEKDVASVTANLDGTWTVDYTLRVTNPSQAGVAFGYDLRDVFDFGAGFSVVGDPTVTGPAGVTLEADWDGASQPIVALGVSLAANAGGTATHTYDVSVTIAFDAEEEEPGLTCEVGEPGAFRNVGSVYQTGDRIPLDEDDACAEPKTPTFAKIADPAGPTLNDDGTWTVKYILRVTNPTYNTAGAQSLFYSLTDLAGASLTGDIQLTGAGWAATGLNARVAWNGIDDTTLVTAAVIGANEQYRDYTVTGTLSIAPGVPADALECDPQNVENTGIVNTATLTHVFGEIPDRACIDIERPTVRIAKDATSVTQSGDGTWLVTYLVSVKNSSPDHVAVYDLVDVPLFGVDAIADSVRWAPSNAAGVFDPAALTAATPLADDKTLATGGTDYYLVQVVADIDAAAWSDEDEDGVLSLPCPTGWQNGGAESGGLLNSATVTAGGNTDTAFGCIEPKLPTIVKSAVGVAQLDDPSQWAVTYKLTVTGKGTATFYDLADVPDFVDGVSIVGPGSAKLGAEGEPLEVPVPVDGEDPEPFVTDVALGATEVQEWLVTWIISVPTQILPPALRGCEEGGLNNQAILTVDGVEQTSDACIPVDEKVYPDMTKTVSGLSRNAETKVWEIVYQIDVTLPGKDDKDAEDNLLNPKGLSSTYDLLEELDYPGIINVVDASWSGFGDGDFADGAVSAQLAENQKILAGAKHTYIVTVHATLATGAVSPNSVVEIGCQSFEETKQIGFFNTATLTFDGLTPVVREACTPPVYPTVAKTPGTVTENEDGTQTVEYFVTVTAPAPVDGQPVSNVIYALKETPDALPSTVALQGKWHAAKVGDDTPVPSAADWDGAGDWNLQAIAGFSAADRTAGRLVHTYRVWADVKVSGVPVTMPEPCLDEGADGIPVWNTVTLAIGEQSMSDDACVRVNYDDVALVKTAGLDEGQTSVQPGDEFDYVLTVTNLGTRDATGVRVTDSTINDRLEIVSIAADGFTFDGDGYTGNDVDLTLNEPLGAGNSAVVTVRVKFLPAVTDGGFIDPDDVRPTAPDPIEVLENKACVTADADSNSDNNCDTEDIPVRDITGVVYTTCQSDAAVLGFFVRTTGNLAALPVTGSWTTDAEPQVSGHSVSISQFVAGPDGFGREIPWPGTAFTPSGVAIDYPGWRPLQASDYTADGQYIDPFDGLPMTEDDVNEKIFNGLILDDSEIDYAWRGATTVVFSVNPEIALHASYPPASIECRQARESDVQIEKTASVEKTDPGKSFTYTLAVANVSDAGAADGVVVTDEIPADIKITDVSWPGEGDDTVFPNWDTCEVTGQDAGGYGGLLECVLFGPLQPAGGEGESAAPTITLAATVNPASTASVITNVAIVDYYTFGDPEDVGWDSDDATVALSALPATGGSPMLPLLMLGFLALLAGVGTMVVIRRRRGEEQLTL